MNPVAQDVPGNWAENPKILGQKSKAPPALAYFQGRIHMVFQGRIDMVHLADSSNDIWHSSFDG